MRTRPRRAKRRDFLLRGGTFFRLLARRMPPGGRPRGWATVTCVLPSSPPHSSRRGSCHQLCCQRNNCVLASKNVWIVFQIKIKSFLPCIFFVFPRRLRYRMKMGSFPAPMSPKAPTCKSISLLQLNIVSYNLQYNHKCARSLNLQMCIG